MNKNSIDNRERLIVAQKIAKMGDFTWNVETGEVTWSDALFTLLGYGQDDTINFAGIDKYIHHPDDANRIIKWLQESIDSGAEVLPQNEYRVIRKDGSVIYVSVTGKILRQQDRTIVFGIVQDITDRKRLEQELVKKNQLLDATGRMARVGGWELDAATNEVTWTDETYRIHEAPPGYIPHLDKAINFFHPDDREVLSEAITKALEKGEPYDMEIRFISAKGNQLWTRTICRPEIEDSKVIKLKGTFQDVTELHRAREEAEQANRELENRVRERTRQLETANAELESFAYSVSHDLRAPLRAISGFADIISSRYRQDLNEQGQHYFDNIVEAGQQMEQLIDDLLTYARLGRKALHKETVDLAGIFRRIQQNFRRKIKRAGARISIPDQLTPVESDSTMIYVILSNIVDNAMTYCAPGIHPEVTVDVQKGEHQIVIEIRDNGIGIDPEHFDTIFDIFQRLQPQSKYPGTGIGLSLVKKAVFLLEGSVHVDSEPGKGSTFYVSLPDNPA